MARGRWATIIKVFIMNGRRIRDASIIYQLWVHLVNCNTVVEFSRSFGGCSPK
jgi:hypothetical protein